MLYEYALISVAIACGYWGIFFVRRPPHGSLTYGLMQLGAATLAGLGLLHGEHPRPALGVAGAIGLGAGTCLLVLAPILRGVARRFAGAERLGIARRVLDLADLLAPGAGAAEEKAVLASMADIRDGKVEPTVDALLAAKRGLPEPARAAVDERIVLLYLAAYRWSDAIAYAEKSFFSGGAAPDRDVHSLRAQLGVSPPVFVELLGAYARTGDLDTAARLLAQLEAASVGRENDAGVWVHRGRLMFLALAGRPAAVAALVAPRASRHMSGAARTYWLAVAHEHQGDRAAAQAAYQRARDRSRGRPRAMIDRALANLHAVAPTALSPLATEVVAQVEAAPLPALVRVPRPHPRPWAVYVVTAVPLLVAAAISIWVGASSDPGVLARSGAMVRGLVDAGEVWRLVSMVLVHVGPVHLAVNTLGLFFLARSTEELFGGARTVAILGLSGVGGGIASYLGAPVGLSAGASGAVFGVLGALVVELTWHREHYRTAWKRGAWGGLVVVTIAQLGVGFAYPVVDQWAHGVGLVTGIVVGFVLSPHARWPRFAHVVGIGLAVVVGVAVVGALALVAARPLSTSLAELPHARQERAGVMITAPTRWFDGGGLADPDGLAIIDLRREPVELAAAQQAAWQVHAGKLAERRELEAVASAPTHALALPVGWVGHELTGSIGDPLGNRQHYRIIAASRVFVQAGQAVMVHAMITAPDSVVVEAPGELVALLASIEPVVLGGPAEAPPP